MILAGLAILAAQAATEEGPDIHDLNTLRFLARHQTESGSWGRPPAGCRCPNDPEPPPPRADEETRRRIGPLIEEFRQDDADRRALAEEEILNLGAPAVPRLREGTRAADPEVAARCRQVLARMAARAEYEDVGTTGLALLAFLGAGYSHLSKDTYDGLCFGHVVRKGLQSLMNRQDASGRFCAETPRDNAIAATALSEAYGMTGSNLLKENAARGVARVAESKPEEPEVLLWKGMVLYSWELGEGENSRERIAAISKDLGSREGTLALAGGVLLTAWAKAEKDEARLGRLCQLNMAGMDPKTLYFTHHALLAADTHRSPRWKERWPMVKDRLVLAQRPGKSGDCARGSCDGEGFRGRLAATAYAALTWQLNYRRHVIIGSR